MSLRLRPFEDRDYERHAEISAAIDPSAATSAEVLRHRDSTREPHIRVLRLAAELEPHGLVGVGRLTTIWWSYHPHRYVMRIDVDPPRQGMGIGSAIFNRLHDELRIWGAELVRTEAPEDRPRATAFLEHRGFRELRRRWRSVLTVAHANVTPLLEAQQRMAADGQVTITTYAEELARRGARLARDLYEMEVVIARDEPAVDPDAESMSFERFMAQEVEPPEALPEAHFLALIDNRLVGVSRLVRDSTHADRLSQAFTGTHPEFRGRGIAQALKLRTVEYARERGYSEIRTSNDSSNAPMLHINAALGFQRETPLVIFERRLDKPAKRS